MIGFVVLGIVAIALGLVFLANPRWAAGTGWVFNKHSPRPSGSGISTFVDEIFHPAVEYAATEEASEARTADRAESGDDSGSDRGSEHRDD